MLSLEFLQQYWWVIVSLLAAATMFLLLTVGAQTLLLGSFNPESRLLMIKTAGRKWQLTYLSLAIFVCSVFAAFPVFFATSFGGAYCLWGVLLFSLVLQAIIYEIRKYPGYFLGTRFYDAILFFNGTVICVVFGVIISMMFFGAGFNMPVSISGQTSAAASSQGAYEHGIESLLDWKCLLFGFVVFFMARTLGGLFYVSNVNDQRAFGVSSRIRVMVNGVMAVALTAGFMLVLFRSPGLRYNTINPLEISPVNDVYLNNLVEMWWLIPILLISAVAFVYAIVRTAFSARWRNGIWYAGTGFASMIAVLFWLAAFCDTAYLPSFSEPHASLTIVNSSAPQAILNILSYLTLLLPVMASYAAYSWHRSDRRMWRAYRLHRRQHFGTEPVVNR